MKQVVNSFGRLSRFNRSIAYSPIAYFATKVVNVPGMGDSITQGTIESYEKNIGDWVDLDEVVAMVETDKITVDIRSPEQGLLTKLFAQTGDTIDVGSPFFEIDVDAAKPAGGAPAPKADAPKADAPQQAQTPKQEAPKQAQQAPPAQKQAPKSQPATQTTTFGLSRNERREPMSRMRLKIAQRLKDAQNTYASLSTFQETDMSSIMEFRKSYQDEFVKKHNVKLGFMSFFMKAAVRCLQDQPVINAVIEGNDVVYRDFVDISVAVATPKGLMVPVVRNCESKSFADIEKELIVLANKGKAGKISPDEMAGGTFTISNGGVFGSMMGTPIINAPQSAILGMHSIVNRPVVRGGEIVARPIMYLTLTYDHRIMDGREAATFLKQLANEIEDPRRILLDL